jgi:hypothetical protein
MPEHLSVHYHPWAPVPLFCKKKQAQTLDYYFGTLNTSVTNDNTQSEGKAVPTSTHYMISYVISSLLKPSGTFL